MMTNRSLGSMKQYLTKMRDGNRKSRKCTYVLNHINFYYNPLFSISSSHQFDRFVGSSDRICCKRVPVASPCVWYLTELFRIAPGSGGMAHQTPHSNVLQRSIAVDNAEPMRDFDHQKIRNMDDSNDSQMNDDPFQGQAYPVWNQQGHNIQMENLNVDQHYVPRGRSFEDVAYEHAHMVKDLEYSEIGYDQLPNQMISNVYSNNPYSDHNTFQSLNSSHDFNNLSSSEDGSFDEVVQKETKNSYEQHLSGILSEEQMPSSPQQDSDEDYEPEQKQDLSQETVPRRSDIKTRTSKRVRVADPDYNEESDEDEDEDIKPDKKELQKQMKRGTWKPETIARPYTLKKAKDREDPLYQLRRAKNNDSVRKSRNKKKEEELAREEKYEQIQEENVALKNRVAELERKLKNCHCQKETARKPGKRC